MGCTEASGPITKDLIVKLLFQCRKYRNDIIFKMFQIYTLATVSFILVVLGKSS